MIALIRAWLKKRGDRQWTAEMQLEHLRILVQEDHRWLAHDATASALTERYLAALAPDWFRRPHTGAGTFRRELGLEPRRELGAGETE